MSELDPTCEYLNVIVSAQSTVDIRLCKEKVKPSVESKTPLIVGGLRLR